MPNQEGEDLSTLLHQVAKDRRPDTRRRIANSVETRRFLDAGITLLLDEIDASNVARDEEPRGEALLQRLSRTRVLQATVAALRTEGITENVGTAESQFRDRWTYVPRFSEDLVAYIFRPWPYRVHLNEVEASLQGELGTAPFGELVRIVSDGELQRAVTDPQMRVQAALQASMPHHPGVRTGARNQYADLLPRWAAIYERIAARYGFILRPGRSWADVATLLNAMVEGASLRAMVDEELARLTTGENVLQAAILLMLPSLIENRGVSGIVDARPVQPGPVD